METNPKKIGTLQALQHYKFATPDPATVTP